MSSRTCTTNAIGSPPCRGSTRVASYDGTPAGRVNGASGVANWRRGEKSVPRCQFVVPQPEELPDQGFHVRRLTLPLIPQVQAAGRDEVRLVERDSCLASCIFREEDLRQRARGLHCHLTEASPAAHRVFLASRPTSSMSCPAVRTRYPCARSCSSSAVHAHC